MPTPPHYVLRTDRDTILRALGEGTPFEALARQHGTAPAPIDARDAAAPTGHPADRPIMALVPPDTLAELRRQADARRITPAQWARELLLHAVWSAHADERADTARDGAAR
jgi:hypothetical protein